jgi:hypothetical protein
MRLDGLRCAIRGHLHIQFYLAWGLSVTHFPVCFVGLDFNQGNYYLKRKKNPRLCLRLDLGVIRMHNFDGITVVEGLVEN